MLVKNCLNIGIVMVSGRWHFLEIILVELDRNSNDRKFWIKDPEVDNDADLYRNIVL